MAQITVRLTPVNYTKAANAAILEAQANALGQAKEFLQTFQRKGEFPSDPKDYQLILRNRGSETRRKFETIRPEYLRIPFSLTWHATTNTDMVVVVDAAKYALREMAKRAPYRTGKYLGSLTIYVNGVPQNSNYLNAEMLDPTDEVVIGPNTKYASTIERGFAKGYYQTETIRGGVIRPVAKMVRAKFGNRVACRFIYVVFKNAGHNMASPVIQIGPIGAFAQNDTSNTSTKKRRRGAR
ncbi:hypothetical protein RGQ15_10355 [Paracoccus sp. MBLB3053]|uniref:Uncharacterized protein n=1 Tax=Paracoccus aurantius TaxID=3073814 RepID=A0ABU2HSF1_9RHOB|nr:hypothetical protein [Paracoccus sp. MBLB3053]MDS9467966.1 hypothetical protein [Paracoccus sp. MBLB3053]